MFDCARLRIISAGRIQVTAATANEVKAQTAAPAIITGRKHSETPQGRSRDEPPW
jgi:hypothetical protein